MTHREQAIELIEQRTKTAAFYVAAERINDAYHSIDNALKTYCTEVNDLPLYVDLMMTVRDGLHKIITSD